MDVEKGKIATLQMWQDKPTLEAALMYPGRYVVSTVDTKRQSANSYLHQPIRLHNIAGKYVGKDDPICIIRTQKDFPATEEAGAAFNNPHLVAGNTRGSHHMPLMPVKINSPASINYAIPIVSAFVFSMHNGVLTGPIDGFATADWDYVRNIAMKRAIAIRSQGFVHPATLVPDELEYAEGYKARMSVLWSKMRPIPGTHPNVKPGQKPNQNNKPGQKPQQGNRPQQGQRPQQPGQKPQQGNRPQQGQRPQQPGQKPQQGNRPQQGQRPQQPGQKPQQGNRPQQGQRPQQPGQKPQQGNRPQQGQRPQQPGQKPQQGNRPQQGQRPQPSQTSPQPKLQTITTEKSKTVKTSTEVKVKKPRAPRKKKTETAATKPEGTVSTTETSKTETNTSS